MKYYHSYMDRQEISPAAHETLMNLVAPVRRSRPWVRAGALAACAALMIGAGVWRLAPAPAQEPGPAQSTGQFTAGHTPPAGDGDKAEASPPKDCFVVSSPVDGDKLMFPMIPGILYQDITGQAQLSADMSRAYLPGSFMVGLKKEDIQAIFWGPEGKRPASHPKTEQGDLPWMLFWDGYAVNGYAWYDGYGQLTELFIWGTKDRAGFTLELRPGALPFSCCIDLDRGDQISEFNGVSVAGWSKVYDRDGDGRTDYICGSEFMTKNDIGVRFENDNSTMEGEYVPGGDMDLGGAQTFNALFVRQALTGGLYLDHLMTNENIPAWRDVSFDSLAQAREEAEFAPYLPTKEPEGYSGNREFHGHLSYQEDRENWLFVRWSLGYDDVEVCVYLDGLGKPYNLADPDDPASYDVRLYSIPWCGSVPEKYRETVNCPAFRAEEMSLELVEARGLEKDTGGLSFDFDVLHPDGTLVSYRCDGLTAEQVWSMVEETLKS